MATAFNTPAGVQVATQLNWIASNAAYSLIKPTIDPNEAKVWGTQDVTGLMENLGGINYIEGVAYRHFEEDRLHQVIIATGTSGALGATITYTIDASDYIASYPSSANEPYVATGTQVNLIPVRVNEVLLFPNGAQGIVTAVSQSAHTFDCVSTNGTVLPTTTTADTIINLGVSVGEGKDMPSSFNVREHVYYNMAEIMSDAHTATGTSLGIKTWVEYEFKGQKQAKWWFKGQSATYRRFRNFREMKLVTGESVTSSSTAAATYDATLARTEGLIPFSTSYNAQNTFNVNSGLTLEDYQNIFIDQLDKNKGTSEYAVWSSIKNVAAIQSFVRSEMKQGGVQYGAFSGGEKQYVDFGFNSFQTLGYTSHLMTYQAFNDPTLLGAAGFTYSDLSLFIPMNKEIYAIGDKKEKTMVPSIRVNYVKNGDTNREWEEFLTGGTGGVYTNTVDTIQINFRSHAGFEGFGANRFGALAGVTA